MSSNQRSMFNAPTSWRPGCGRPHPDYETAVEWLSGRLPTVAVQRITIRGQLEDWTEQEFPNWDPRKGRFKIPDIQSKFHRIYTVRGEETPRMCSAGTEAEQAIMELEVLKKHGNHNVTWIIPWSTNQPRRRDRTLIVPKGSPLTGGIPGVIMLEDRRKIPRK